MVFTSQGVFNHKNGESGQLKKEKKTAKWEKSFWGRKKKKKKGVILNSTHSFLGVPLKWDEWHGFIKKPVEGAYLKFLTN